MSSQQNSPLRVLLVDDEDSICRVITRTLELNGFEAKSASSLKEVQDALRTEEFDVVLLDCSVSNEKGESLVGDVRQAAPQAKVVFFTGRAVAPAEAAQVDGVILKPIAGKSLAQSLRKVIAAP